MPNQPKTPLHSFRVEDDLWEKARTAARANGVTIADVLRAALRSYLDQHPSSNDEGARWQHRPDGA